MKLCFYRITICSNQVYRLLNNDSIAIYDTILNDDTFEFSIDSIYFEAFDEICKRNNIQIISSKKRGLITKIVNKRLLKTVGITSAAILLLIYINSFFLWNIEIKGNYSYSSDRIINYIQNNKHAKIGGLKAKIKTNRLNECIRSDFKNISWVSCQVKGTNLIVSVKENYITDIRKKEKKNYSIVASKNGVIKSIVVRKGIGCVKKNQKVKKGDLLINGVIEVSDEYEQPLFTKFCKADGEIQALVTEKYFDSINKKYKRKYNLKKKIYYIPLINGLDFGFKKNNKCDYIIKNNHIKIFKNIYTPLKIKKITKIEYEEKTNILDKNSAREILYRKMDYKLAIYEQKGYKIQSKNVRMVEDKNQFKLTGGLKVIEPIGSVEYIDTSSYREEITKQNECN